MRVLSMQDMQTIHKITADERTKRRLNMATLTDDGEMVYRITSEDLPNWVRTRLLTQIVFTVGLATLWAVIENIEADKLCLLVKDLKQLLWYWIYYVCTFSIVLNSSTNLLCIRDNTGKGIFCFLFKLLLFSGINCSSSTEMCSVY
jgi:hypothetical protein